MEKDNFETFVDNLPMFKRKNEVCSDEGLEFTMTCSIPARYEISEQLLRDSVVVKKDNKVKANVIKYALSHLLNEWESAIEYFNSHHAKYSNSKEDITTTLRMLIMAFIEKSLEWNPQYPLVISDRNYVFLLEPTSR